MHTPDGNGWPDGGGPSDSGEPPDGLPDLPPEWGPIVIPDDPSELAEESELVRRELRRRARRDRWLNWFGLPPARPGDPPSLRLPLLIILVAVLATAAGLSAVTWPRSPRPTTRASAAPEVAPNPAPGRPLPALELIDSRQAPVSLRSLLPAVILLLDGCTCPEQVRAAAQAAPPGVTVIPVAGTGVPVAPPSGLSAAAVRPLADPAGGLRAFVQVPPYPDGATAVLADGSGRVVRIVPRVGSVADYRGELESLAVR